MNARMVAGRQQLLAVLLSKQSRCAPQAAKIEHETETALSSCTFHMHDGQVASAGCEVNIDLDPRTRLTLHQCCWPCTRRGAWPALAWFVARFTVGRIASSVDLIRRPSAQRHVRSVRVVPIDRRADFAVESALAQGHQRQTTEQRLERKDQSLDDRQAPVLADRAISWRLDPLTPAPTPETVAVELGPVIADDVAGGFAGSYGQNIEPTRKCQCWLMLVHRVNSTFRPTRKQSRVERS